MKYAWIEAQRDRFWVASMCRLLGVSGSGLYDWRSRPASQRSQDDARLAVELRAPARAPSRQVRAAQAYRRFARGRLVNHKRVHRRMRREGLQARRPRRFVRTTDSRHAFALAPNVLQQRFVATRPNRVWLADIPYVATDEGWLFVASSWICSVAGSSAGR